MILSLVTAAASSVLDNVTIVPHIAGSTTSVNYPITNGAYDNSVQNVDAFVTKFSADASSLLYSTVIGGSAGEDYRLLQAAPAEVILRRTTTKHKADQNVGAPNPAQSP